MIISEMRYMVEDGTGVPWYDALTLIRHYYSLIHKIESILHVKGTFKVIYIHVYILYIAI